jgi:D-glycero-D-manno-heptose 1,7-bisphosphate phosphatase
MIIPDGKMDLRPVKPLLPQQTPVLYTDIDGTIRHGKDELGHFVNTVEDVKVFEEVPDLLWAYKNLGWRIIGISNQAGVGLGHMTIEACFAQMGETQRQCRVAFDKIVFCAHRPYDDCPCRKPKAGMVFDCQKWLNINYPLEEHPMGISIFVGDRPEDEMCATNAGLRFVDAKDWRRGKHFDEVLMNRNRKHGLGES